MSGYVGRGINYGNAATDHFTGNGGATYTLNYDTTTDGVIVSLDGVVQKNGTDFNVTSGTSLVFTSVVASPIAIQVVYTGLTLALGTPADGTVSTAKIVNNAVDETKLKDALIGDFTDATVTASDTFLHGDATDSGNTKRDTIQGILDLATSDPAENIIIDGDFSVWPEGSSARALGGSGGYTSALLYGLEDYSSGSATVERSTDVPTVAQSNHSSSYSALAKCTLDAVPGSSQQCFLAYRITGSDYRKIHAQQVTISFWAKTSAQNDGHTYYLVLRNSAFNRHYVTSFTVTSSWQQFTKTITLDNSGTWLFTEADIGMEIRFQLGKESTYANTTADAWGSGVGAGVSSMSNFLNHTSNEFYLSQFQLVKGSSAPSGFVSEPIATVKKQVAWYFQNEAEADVTYKWAGHGGVTSSSTLACKVRYSGGAMRAIPTITSSAASTWTASDHTTGGTVTAISFSGTSKDRTLVNITYGGGWTAGRYGYFYRNNAATTYLYLDARH